VDKPSVEVRQSQERLNSLYVSWARPIGYRCDLGGVHNDFVMRYNVIHELGLGDGELAFLQLVAQMILP
jgi:hypothetical protein